MMGDISEVERKDKTSHLRNIIVTANTSLGYPYHSMQQQQQQQQQKYPGTPGGATTTGPPPPTQSNFQGIKVRIFFKSIYVFPSTISGLVLTIFF